jgi:hypothetical protein
VQHFTAPHNHTDMECLASALNKHQIAWLRVFRRFGLLGQVTVKSGCSAIQIAG